MYWLILIIAVISGCLALYAIYDSNIELTKIAGAIFVVTFVYSYMESSRFDEISNNDYELVIKTKQNCINYSTCEEILKDILEDKKIKKYELSKYKETLDKEMESDKKYNLMKIEDEREKKNKEQLEKIKEELNTKK